MASEKRKTYLVSGEVRVAFSVEVEAEDEIEAEVMVEEDYDLYDLVDSGDVVDVEVDDVECLTEEDDDVET